MLNTSDDRILTPEMSESLGGNSCDARIRFPRHYLIVALNRVPRETKLNDIIDRPLVPDTLDKILDADS
jgi:hypothetical protein